MGEYTEFVNKLKGAAYKEAVVSYADFIDFLRN